MTWHSEFIDGARGVQLSAAANFKQVASLLGEIDAAAAAEAQRSGNASAASTGDDVGDDNDDLAALRAKGLAPRSSCLAQHAVFAAFQRLVQLLLCERNSSVAHLRAIADLQLTYEQCKALAAPYVLARRALYFTGGKEAQLMI